MTFGLTQARWMTKFAGTWGKKIIVILCVLCVSARACVFRTCGLAGNPLPENARGGALTITTMFIVTNRTVNDVSTALCHDATMGKPGRLEIRAGNWTNGRKADAAVTMK